MTQTDNAYSSHLPPSLTSRFLSTALILAALYLSYFHNLGAIGLVGPDEPRYAWIARDMLETRDWVTPRLYGKPWFEKPALYYWEAALSFKFLGVSDAAARLPSAFSALLATLALAWLTRRLYGSESSRWLLLLLPTTVGMIGFSHAAATDMPFSAMLTLAMVSAAFILGLLRDEHTPILPRTPWLALVLFGSFLGLAVLAKGPAAIVLTGGSVLLWALFTHRWRDAFRCLHPVAIISFCLTSLPWYLLCSRRNPDFFRVFIIEHNFKRYLTPQFEHIQPFWFYIPITLLAVFPWTILLIPATEQLLATIRLHGREFNCTLFFLCWAAFPLIFFSVSKSKLPGYLLPVVSPLVLLLATSLAAILRSDEKPPRWIFVLLALGVIALGLLLTTPRRDLSAYTHIRLFTQTGLVYSAALLSALAGLAFTLFRRVKSALYASAISVLFLVVVTDHLLTEIDPALTARSAVANATRQWPQFSPSSAATWELTRSQVYQLNFYTRSVLPEWQTAQPKPSWLFVSSKHLSQARAFGFDCPVYPVYPAVVPCGNTSSVGGLAALGGSRDDRVRDRQPR